MATSLPKTMRAIGIRKTGGLEVIEELELPVPTPEPEEVLVKVEWAGVNYADTYNRSGLYQNPLPFTIGLEGTGTIVALPTSSKILQSEEFKSLNLAIGDRVAGYHKGGSFAEYWALPWHRVPKLPSSIDFRLGAATVCQGLTALTSVTEGYEVKKGDWILVHAAAGGLGLLLCQMASHFGAHVIGTTSTPEKAELARQNGAEHIILYTHENVVEKVLELTSGKGVKAVFDGVGKDTWEDNFKLTARKGTIISIGNASGAVPPFSPLKLSSGNFKLLRPTLANYLQTSLEMQSLSSQLFELVAEGAVRFKIYGEYEFSAEGIRKSQEDITGRGTVGKLIVKIA